MRCLAFAARNRKEILRDPLSLAFGLGFPLVLILLISLMQRNIVGMPTDIFGIENFAPGMAVFGLSFLSLFLGMLMANDRSTSFLMRLFASPLRSFDYILGYSLPLLPLGLVQGLCCFLAAACFGLRLNVHILLALLVLVPVGALFISFGLLLGSQLTYGQVGGVASILVNVAAWLSGTWFPLEMIGGAFRTICNLLPFVHAVEAVQAALQGQYAVILAHLAWVIGYAALVFLLATVLFRRKMYGGKA